MRFLRRGRKSATNSKQGTSDRQRAGRPIGRTDFGDDVFEDENGRRYIYAEDVTRQPNGVGVPVYQHFLDDGLDLIEVER